MNELAQNIRNRLDKPLVMVGLMGAGKTKMGSLLAKELGLPFVDADQEIESIAGCSVADIFETHGEPAFRDLERKVLARLLSEELKIIAPGGGAVMHDETAALVWEKSISIWLKADLDVLVERTSRNNKRPLLRKGNPRGILAGLMEKRHPVYRKATLTVETDSSEIDHTLQKLMKSLDAHLFSCRPDRSEV
ncbi:MAG TPA: shikimate kinase [Micavibrio sp.]|nr:shikimate kinase [Micavibrio sp.]